MSSINSEQPKTLLRYNNPVYIGNVNEPEDKLRQSRAFGPSADTKTENQAILNTIFPPRQWEDNGHIWQQTVSEAPGTPQDVDKLEQMLDARLAEVKASKTGICSKRRELYSQCFDELLRQVTVNGAERGMLLNRVRNEISMSLEAQETLYCSAVEYGRRKASQGPEEQDILQNHVQTLKTKNQKLKEKYERLKEKKAQMELDIAILRATDGKRFGRELAFLQKSNGQLQSYIDKVTETVEGQNEEAI